MRKLLLAAAGAALVLGSGVASAQDWAGFGGWSPAWGHGPAAPPAYGGGWVDHGLRERIDRMGAWVSSGQSQGWLSPWDARRAYGDLHAVRDQLRQLEWQDGGGLYQGQQYALNSRLDHLADRLRSQQNGGW